MTYEGVAKINDPAVMRALAHPARMAIMEHLTATRRPSTATECAEVVGLSPSAVSYHLRALAKSNLIEEAPSRGDGRERLWQSPYRGVSVGTDQDVSPETRAAEMVLINAFLAREEERVKQWFASSSQEPPDWFRAAIVSETILNLTADELTTLVTKVQELIDPYRRAERSDPPEGSRLVSWQYRGVPLPTRS